MVRFQNRRGFTLTEAMLTIAIIGILAAVAAPIMVNVNNFWRQTTARNEVQKDVAVSLDNINRHLRQARARTIILDQVSGQPPFSRITFITQPGHTISFYQNNNQLMMSLDGTLTTLSRNVGYIAFTFPRTDDNTIISVAITMQRATYLGSKKALQLSIQKVRIMNL